MAFIPRKGRHARAITQESRAQENDFETEPTNENTR